MRQFVEKCWNRPNLTFGDLWWPDLWPDLKNDRRSFFMFFDALSNAVYRVSLHGPWAELDGGVQTPPGPARSAPSSGPARVKRTVSELYFGEREEEGMNDLASFFYFYLMLILFYLIPLLTLPRHACVFMCTVATGCVCVCAYICEMRVIFILTRLFNTNTNRNTSNSKFNYQTRRHQLWLRCSWLSSFVDSAFHMSFIPIREETLKAVLVVSG